MKYATVIGVLAGFLLAFAVIQGGLVGFLVTILFCAIGGLAGAHYEGLIDLRSLWSNSGRGRG